MANFVPAGYEDEYSDDSDDFAFNYYHNVSHSFNLLLDVFLYIQGPVKIVGSKVSLSMSELFH